MPSGTLLGAFWGPLEGSQGFLGGPRAIVVPPGCLLGRLGLFWGRHGALLGASWARPGARFGCAGGLSGRLGPFLGRLGAPLRVSGLRRGSLGPCWTPRKPKKRKCNT
eukprot:3299082-Pyramimonas_sp.AAC.1